MLVQGRISSPLFSHPYSYSYSLTPISTLTYFKEVIKMDADYLFSFENLDFNEGV